MGDHNEVPGLIVPQHQQQQQLVDWEQSTQQLQLSINRAPYQPGSPAQKSSSSSNNLQQNPNAPRRTRHRVDAGEPRGCFNNTLQNQIGYFPRNQFFHHHHHHQVHQQQQHNQVPSRSTTTSGYNNFPPYHFGATTAASAASQFASGGSNSDRGSQVQGGGGSGSSSSSEYYFQPMKMLSEFISSANAVAAAQAAQQQQQAQAHHHQSQQGKKNQFLREMLCKEQGDIPVQGSSRLNNNNIINNNKDEPEGGGTNLNKSSSSSSSKLDGMIGLMMDKLNNSSSTTTTTSNVQEPEVPILPNNPSSLHNERESSSDTEAEAQQQQHQSVEASSSPQPPPTDMDTESNNNNNNNNAADLLNNNTQAQMNSSVVQGRNKRKKYQPVKSDLISDNEISDDQLLVINGDDMIVEEEEEEAHTRRITRSQVKKEEEEEEVDEDIDEKEQITSQEYDDVEEEIMTRNKRKLEPFLDDDMDEDDAMLLRPITSGSRSSAATTNPDDMESIQEFDNEEDEQEAMINDDLDRQANKEKEQGSRRTLPVVRNLMRMPMHTQQQHHHGGNLNQRLAGNKEAPLTRQLLTSERPTSTPSSSSLSMDQKPPANTPLSLLRSRVLPPSSSSSPPPPAPLSLDLPNGMSNAPPANFLQQWKENLKTTLMSHINELVDAQFSLLLGGNMLPPSALLAQERRQLRENNNRVDHKEHHHQNKRTPPPPPSSQQQQQALQQQPPPRSSTPREPTPKPLMHLNGGSVLNNDNNKMLMSPPMMEKKLPVARSTPQQQHQDFPSGVVPHRFPFMQNIQNGQGGNGKPHFSSALVGLTQHHLQQQAMAAAVAAGAAVAGIENFLENESPLSLVVNRGNQGVDMGNVTPPKRKRHKVTDTRLTPRAVSRLLGQVDSNSGPTQSSTSPLYDHNTGSSPTPSPNNLMEPRSILQNGTPPPRTTDNHPPPSSRGERNTPQQQNSSEQQQQRTPFNPFPGGAAPPPFFHPAAALAAAAAAHSGHPLHHHRLDSPPMGASLLHPALQNTNEYVERLREISMERDQERNTRVGSDNVVVRDRGDHHVGASLREYPSIRGLRDRSTGGGGVVIGNDMMDLIRGGSGGGGSDSGGEGSGGFDLGSSGGGGAMYCKWSHTTSTLTPMHLRKAKLMFFWTRYPSSAVIKMYFPDIKFNKNNTAQLVKWFSNFREFYYIQMEKYARQALSEGVKSAEDLIVTTESELYRVLNLHYNRNNHIEVPPNFRFVVEQTLREFFKSVQAGKDSEQSWKKAIYKIIARLDDPVPEYFKSPNFLEQLE